MHPALRVASVGIRLSLHSAMIILWLGFAGSAAQAQRPDYDMSDQLKIFPVTSTTTHLVSNVSGGMSGVDEKLIYTNPLANFAAEIPPQQLLSDDIRLSVATNCPLRRFTFQVIGKANPNACGGPGISCGPVTMEFEMFDECPGAGGLPIDGTAGCVSNDPGRPECLPMPSEFDITEIEFVVPQGNDVLLPSSLWLGVIASRPGAGIVLGTPALHGFSDDVIDFLGFPCSASLGGFPENPHASFNVSVYGNAACADTGLTYQNVRAGYAGVNAGADNCIADDITVNRICNMVEMEVGVRNPGIYDIELRRSLQDLPAGDCVGGSNSMQWFEIPGTYKRFLVTQHGLAVRRFEFDPPVLLPSEDLFTVLVPNNTNAQWILTGRDASVGNTLATYVQWDGDGWQRVLRASNVYGGFHVTITCAGAPPLGACCDQYVRDEVNEAVCRDVAEINCPFPPEGSALRPAWAEGIFCNVCSGGEHEGSACQVDDDCGASGACVEGDPFQLPCGVNACCRPDGSCINLTQNECQLLWLGSWQLGEFCHLWEQQCPHPPCLGMQGDCFTANPKTCNGGPDVGDSCLFDANCTSTNDGTCQSFPPVCLGGDHDGDDCFTDLDCIPGGLCRTDTCVGGARAGEECAAERDCRESFCESSPGCSDPECCTAVCQHAPGPPIFTDFCCEVHWDPSCVALAAELCTHLEPENDTCAPTDRTSGAIEIVVNGLPGTSSTQDATISTSDGFCCYQGIGRCDGGCTDDAACYGDSDCTGRDDGFCNFPDDYSAGTCTDGCNAQDQCLNGDANPPIIETTCFGGPNNGLPCKPRCNGGADNGEPCASEDDCAGGVTCDGTIDCLGSPCDNSFCEGADDGVCADSIPEPGNPGVASVWYYFTVPEEAGSETASIEVSTCDSTNPAIDSLLQVYATADSDAGLCDDLLGVCDDGSFCDRVAQDCGDASECLRTELACSVSEQDCPIPTAVCEFDLGTACDSLSVIGCNDDAGSACGNRPQLSAVCMPDLKRGETYFVGLSAKTEEARGEYRVRVRTVTECEADPGGSCVDLFCVGGALEGEPCANDADCVLAVQPANDYCPGAIDIPAVFGDTVIPFSLDGATFDCREAPCNANLQNDIWYTWTAPVDGTVEIKTCGDGEAPPPDTEMMVYFRCDCPAETAPFTPLCYSASNNPACMTSAGTLTPLDVEAGDCLMIRIGDNRGSGGTGELTVTYAAVPECGSGSIISLDPPNGVTDAGWEVNCSDPASLLGIDTIQVFGPANSAIPECWTLCESGAIGTPNSIVGVIEQPVGEYTITLARPITPGQCTSIIYNELRGSPSSATYTALPGDVDGNGATNATDVLNLIDALNGINQAPWGGYSTDVDRSGATTATDVLAMIDLLDGAGACASWNNVRIQADCGACPAP